ncbi:MAG TPA: TetR family transcriptional regulator [Solirubrobacter sp.]|nr:TetR family transcriptional regulator [Solirubrobacter sp.]
MTRAQSSQRVRDAIVAATVKVVARDGVAAVTHRAVAREAGVSLSSTTWHYATKADILEAALRWTARHEVERVAAYLHERGPEALADWLIEQVTSERETTLALYRLQIELLSRDVHREWGRGLQALGDEYASALDVRLVIAALDGLRLSVLLSGEDPAWLREAVRRQLAVLLGD